MPELPEIETIVSGLNDLIPGKILEEVTWDWAKSFPNSAEDLESILGSSVKKVQRRGKAVIIELSVRKYLLIHLKMTGQLVYQDLDSEGPFPDRSTRVIFSFTDGSTLYFNDFRKFGRVWILSPQELKKNKFLSSLGPEPLSRSFTARVFKERMARRKDTFVKAALLDQTVVAGIGNIYCDEALFIAGIMPDRRVRTLTDEEYRRLHRAIRKVLKRSVELGGSTRANYRNARGEIGHYLDHALVYNRQGQPCDKCGEPIIKTRVAGRGTHFCQFCQK